MYTIDHGNTRSGKSKDRQIGTTI